VVHDMLTLPGNLSSLQIFSGVRVTQTLFYVHVLSIVWSFSYGEDREVECVIPLA
jgi:hypothetical protein